MIFEEAYVSESVTQALFDTMLKFLVSAKYSVEISSCLKYFQTQ